MNAAVLMQSCPDHETLSAFIDQRSDPKSRLEVVKHLAECADCRALVVAANEYRVENGAEGGDVGRGRFGSRWVVPLAAAAAMVVVLFGIREGIFSKSGMTALVEAANSLPERSTDARLSGDFVYKDYKVSRGNDDKHPWYQVELAASQAEQRAQENPTPAHLHAAGVAGILMKDRTKAVETLKRAAIAGVPSAAVLNDLSAAYIARGMDGDYQLALDVANKALAFEKMPAAVWNRALALELLERKQEAITAWSEYLVLDPRSPWASEATEKRQGLIDSLPR
jgi:tetratricopeptide (TPR) repeat protein